ncbi:MFS transporter [Streptomyces sp. NPDC050610]|uniref:MFS transporter n=1 Tax=Streptomyces sp. NPDC050610 TaxID=3157097 RepID=UPI00342CD920
MSAADALSKSPDPARRQTRRAFRGLLAARLLGALADGAMLPFIVLWAHETGGLSGASAGMLFLALAFGELAGGLAGGVLADRVGHRRMLLISTIGMAAGYSSLFLVHHAVLALVAFLTAGIFEAAFHPTIAALIADLHQGQDLHHAYGMTRVAASLGSIAGPIVGAAAVSFSLSCVFAVAGILLLGAVLAVFLAVPPDRAIEPAQPEAEPDHVPGGLMQVLRDRRLLLLVVGGGLLSITFTWWEADGLVLLNRLHAMGTSAFAALFAVDAAATVLFQMPISRWARDRSTARLLFAGAALQGVGLAGLAAAGAGYPALVAAVLLISFGMMLAGPATSAFVSRHAPPGRSATYQAALSTTQDIGTAIGPTSGLAIGRIGPPALVWLLALPLSLIAGLATAKASGPLASGQTAGAARTRC